MLTPANDALEIRGLSTDTKPTSDNIENGSIFFEMNTSKVFVYDKEHKQWVEL